jgi:hypothetical protein
VQQIETAFSVAKLRSIYDVKISGFTRSSIYRVFHDFMSQLQEVISYVFVIKKLYINMCPILDGYGVMTV